MQVDGSQLAWLVLKYNQAELAACESGQELDPRVLFDLVDIVDPGFVSTRRTCRPGTENQTPVAQVLKLQKRKESSKYESRFFSHYVGSKYGGHGRLCEQELCPPADDADHQQDQ
jgi:hypothetical protein